MDIINRVYQDILHIGLDNGFSAASTKLLSKRMPIHCSTIKNVSPQSSFYFPFLLFDIAMCAYERSRFIFLFIYSFIYLNFIFFFFLGGGGGGGGWQKCKFPHQAKYQNGGGLLNLRQENVINRLISYRFWSIKCFSWNSIPIIWN